MKRIFASPNTAEVGLLKTLLEQEGIDCFTRHEPLSMAIGSLPFLDSQPEIWVSKDEDEERANQFLKDWQNDNAVAPEPWVCPECGETNEGQFAACWKCDYLIDG